MTEVVDDPGQESLSRRAEPVDDLSVTLLAELSHQQYLTTRPPFDLVKDPR